MTQPRLRLAQQQPSTVPRILLQEQQQHRHHQLAHDMTGKPIPQNMLLGSCYTYMGNLS